MTVPDQPGNPAPESHLQFDRAEPVSPVQTLTCAVCKQPISSSYYEINGRTVCSSCKARIEFELQEGDSAGRFGKALGLGAAGAVAGAALFYGIEAATGYRFGLVAIVVGLLVGGGVRKGSSARGGARYQALAMVLTYLSIVATYVPYLVSDAPAGATVPLLVGIALAAPIIAGVQSPIGLIITAIAIYEAWKINRGAALRITGPYQVGARA